jgi:hypothetical protein
MNKRTVKTIVIAASVVGLTGATAATAWADTFTPGIEEPTADLGLPGGNGQDLLGGSSPLSKGNQSSASGTNGKTYGSGYGDESYGGSYGSDDQQDNGYWRKSSGSSGSSDNGYWRSGGGYSDSDSGY